MSFIYAVLGAGRQGVAAAYDLARLGDAKEVRLFDLDAEAAARGAEKINKLLETQIVQGQALDVSNPSLLVSALRGAHSTISAVPYKFNLAITEAAIEVHSNICDLGGHTETVRRQLDLLKAGEETFVASILERLTAKPPNFERVIAINEGRKSIGERDPLDIEAGPNRCAVR